MLKKVLLNFKSNKNNKLFAKGFSLGEVMLATFLVGVSLTVIAKLMVDSISGSIESRHNIVAANLAQEGVEVVRNIRDNNIIKGIDPFTGFPPADDVNCLVDKNSVSIQCGAGLDKRLYGEVSSGYFVHGSGESTIYYRKIEIISGMSGGDKEIVSVVSWGSDFDPSFNSNDCAFSNRCIAVRSKITN